MNRVQQKKTPKWLLSLYYHYHAASKGNWVSNEQMAKSIGGGYWARNHLAVNGDITKRGIEHETRKISGSRFKLYKLKYQSLQRAREVLTAHGLIKE